MLSPVSTWHCSHLSPSPPRWASSCLWQASAAQVVGVSANLRCGWHCSHLFFLCSPLSGNAVTWPLASLGNGWSWSNLSASHTPELWHVMHLSPSVPLCSESSWHWPAALQLGLRSENEVLPFLSRPVWRDAHGTSLCFLTRGNEPLGPWTSAMIALRLVSTMMLPPLRWHCRHCALLYLPSGCSSSAWTLACAWHDLQSLVGLSAKRSKSDGLEPRWHARQVTSACLNSSLNLVCVAWLKLLAVHLGPPDGWQVSQRGGEPNSLNRSPCLLSLAWHCSHVRLGLTSPSALVWHCSHLIFLCAGPRSNRVRSL